ncbi:MAG: TlpA family protein disulfide reductase, partial [Treponema porcinum]
LLHFWATWCPPCVRELPYIAKIAAERQDEITVLAISAGETKETVVEYINSKDGDFSSFVSGCDEDSSISFMYNVTAIPYTLFISADGIITDTQMGAYTPERLKSAVDKAVRTSE